ncbi:hypothetical protein [Halomicrococcus sp. NG-SE-24]|uniref:hypothetical protein n=1 Tax=Halomicrococcus sp. NG-SE-24 TaxID=3436928 RepID=UPI003D9570A6
MKLGEANSRLFERDGDWYLHITAHREIEQETCPESDDVTPVGVDIGKAALTTVCHRDERDSPAPPELWTDEATTVRQLRERYFSAKRRLQRREAEKLDETYGETLWRRSERMRLET